MSAASIILQAADKRVLSKHCIVMIHDGEDSNTGSPAHVLKWAKFGLKVTEMMYDIYTDGAGHNSAYWKRKCQEDYILTAAEAVAEGLADEII
jgi:ATP-dependent protease ClpP protease subunit